MGLFLNLHVNIDPESTNSIIHYEYYLFEYFLWLYCIKSTLSLTLSGSNPTCRSCKSNHRTLKNNNPMERESRVRVGFVLQPRANNHFSLSVCCWIKPEEESKETFNSASAGILLCFFPTHSHLSSSTLEPSPAAVRVATSNLRNVTLNATDGRTADESIAKSFALYVSGKCWALIVYPFPMFLYVQKISQWRRTEMGYRRHKIVWYNNTWLGYT